MARPTVAELQRQLEGLVVRVEQLEQGRAGGAGRYTGTVPGEVKLGAPGAEQVCPAHGTVKLGGRGQCLHCMHERAAANAAQRFGERWQGVAQPAHD